MHRNYYLSCLDDLDGSGLANFFKLFLCISEKSLENNYSLFFRQENFSIFFPVLYEQFHFKKKTRLFVKYLSGFDQNIAKLP